MQVKFNGIRNTMWFNIYYFYNVNFDYNANVSSFLYNKKIQCGLIFTNENILIYLFFLNEWNSLVLLKRGKPISSDNWWIRILEWILVDV